MREVLAALPSRLRSQAHVFCLRAVAECLAEIRRLAPATAGFAAPGRLLTDVSFINASGLVRRGAIRRTGRPPLAFFERPEWMAAWFPGYDADVVAATVRTAAVLIPAMMVTEASGSSTQARRRQPRSPRTVVISTSRGSRLLIAACVVRTMGSSA